jgi:hypothetical protein
MLDSRRYCRYHRGAHRSIRVGLGKVTFHDMSGTSSGVPGFPLALIHPSAWEADQQKYSASFLSLGPSRAGSLMGLRAVHGVARGADQSDQAPGKLSARGAHGNSSPAATVEGARRSPCKAESCTTAAGFVPSYPRAAAMRTHCRSGSLERDTEVDFEHSLEHGPCYPLSVKVDATRNARAHRLEEIFVALENDEDLLVLQVPALQLPVGRGVQGDPQRPGESFS